MVFESFTAAHWFLLWSAFGIAAVMGAVANKTDFCTMGAVSDIVNMQDWGRMRAWLLAIVVAIFGVTFLELAGLVNAAQSVPPFRNPNFRWIEALMGGLIFGVGMTLGSGCGNKTVVRIGGGNLKSIVVAIVLGTVAWFMLNPIPGTDATLYSLLFHGWTQHLSITLRHGQDIGAVLGGADAGGIVRAAAAVIIGGGLLFLLFRAAEFRTNFDQVFGGLMIGLCVVGVWVVSSNVFVEDDFGDQYSLREYVQDWDFLAEPGTEGRPERAGPLGPQGVNFVSPIAQTLNFTVRGFETTVLTVGIMVVLGVIVGSFIWSLISRRFRVEWFVSKGDFFNHVIGGVLMGMGGVLSMGCTFGQGITGMSTLALSAPITMGAIVLGSAMTMKIQYYKMLYEEEATFGKAFVTGLVDLRLLPSSMRKLDAL